MSEETPKGLDVPKVSAFFERELPQLPTPLSFERIGDGRSNLTFAVTASDGTQAVLRRPPLGPLLPKAHDMAREHRVLSAFGAAGAPVPETYALCTDTDVLDVPFYVMEKIDGTVLTDMAAAERFDVAARRRMGESLVDVLAQLHAVDVDAAGIGDLGPREDWVARQLRRWMRQWEASKTEDNPLVEDLAERFGTNIPPQPEATIVHGDYRLGNVIVGDDGTVLGVLDWELCALGEPLGDLGYTLAFWAGEGKADPPPPEDDFTTLEGYLQQDDLIARYAETTGRSFEHAKYFHAFSIWRLAIIVQGVHRRVQENPDNVRGGGNANLRGVQDLLVACDDVARAAGI